nr:crosslink repair DNA glycosylase YcaQ family protein [bacterium]
DDRTLRYVRDRMTAEGPLAAKDFENPGGKHPGGWWEWKPAKKALEQLFLDGTLMVKERRGFQKVFDLTERVLPDGVDQRVPDRDELVQWIIRSSLRAHGIATLPEIAYAFPRLKPAIQTALREMMETGLVAPCRIHGDASTRYYCLSDDIENAMRIRYAHGVHILNPFDNAVIQRRRVKALFGFDYVFECYVPAAKRRFGYFSLPLLVRDRFIGLADCKAHRKEGRLEVKAIHILDPRPPKDFQGKLAAALERFAAFNGVKKVAMP